MGTSGGRHDQALLIGALGVVYGDIGTSPLYALRECFNGPHGLAPVPENVMGVVSLILWTLIVIVTIKYLGLVLRADHQGEGGILALLSLAVPERRGVGSRGGRLLVVFGLFGAALMYGDGIITPALTVMSAVEGLEVATPLLKPYVVPMAVLVLVGLFSVQRFGTGKVGSIFGPIMLLWFGALAGLGVYGIWRAPEILAALSPHQAGMFLLRHSQSAFVVMGSVFLVVTGAEALYADMGHFGASPIRRAWLIMVFPALVLNYFGQGALLLGKPESAVNPFFMLGTSWTVLPMVGLATMAAVIASQALISGAYSLTMQAIQMGYLPRLIIQHTSHSQRGQIYMPQVNGFLMIACVGLVLGFQSSSKLAGAYGIAVSLTMLITTMLLFAAARRIWRWSIIRAGVICGAFVAIELAFATANSLKLREGGWLPLAIGLVIFAQMTTWKKGRQTLRARLSDVYLPFDLFLKDLESAEVLRVPGTAVFLSGNRTGTPLALLHNLRHNSVLHERVVILTVETKDVPYVTEPERLEVERLRPDIYRITGHYGFMETANIPLLLELAEKQGLAPDPVRTTYFLSRETIIPSKNPGMATWRRRLFSVMSRNAQGATSFFQLPPNRVVELGMQVEV